MLDLMRIIAFFALMNGGLDIAVGVFGIERPQWPILDGLLYIVLAVEILFGPRRAA